MLQFELIKSDQQSPPDLLPAMRKKCNHSRQCHSVELIYSQESLPYPHLPAGMVKRAAKCQRSRHAAGAAVRCQPLQPRLGEPTMFDLGDGFSTLGSKGRSNKGFKIALILQD